MSIILVDIDEVLFPFAQTYRDYRERLNLPVIPWQAWNNYKVDENHIPGHQELMSGFYRDAEVVNTQPLWDRVRFLEEIAIRDTVIACTSRYFETESEGTLEWRDRWIPWMEIIFVGWHPESGRSSDKPVVAAKLKAAAVIDDSPVHLLGLPEYTLGLLTARPVGVPSAPGSMPWLEVERSLTAWLD